MISPLSSRRIIRCASAKSLFRPGMPPVDPACAKCNPQCPSNSSHTGFQYWAVDSITTSLTCCSASHSRKACNSLVVVPNLRCCRSRSLTAVRSRTTTANIFLCTSIPATLPYTICIFAPARRSGGRSQTLTHSHALPSLHHRELWRAIIDSKPAPRIKHANGLNFSSARTISPHRPLSMLTLPSPSMGTCPWEHARLANFLLLAYCYQQG